MNEPFLDPEIEKRIRYIFERKRLPTYIKVNTNASLLTEELAERILDSGLDVLTCSVHGIVKEKYDRTMAGLHLEEVLHGIDRFLEIKSRMKKKKPDLRVTMVRTKLMEPDLGKIKSYWRSRGVKVSVRPMTNRADKRINSLKIHSNPFAPYDWCIRLMQQAHINVKGQVLLCCNDWEQTIVLGDLTKQSLHEIWNGEAFQTVRRRFLERDWQGLPCASCLMPKRGH
jgi:MoaA/NifB/PqqE/SkfB family radical SAM enzyme